jgi:Domain of Unknown Function (DUF928)
MTHAKWLLHKLFNTTVLASFALTTTLTLSLTQRALAEYKPPPDQKQPSGYTDSSGVRGGCRAMDNSGELTLLAPVTHVGQTSSLHSTFAWFVPNYQSMPVEFSIYEFDTSDQPNKLAYKHQLKSSPGIMKLSLPQEQQGLKVGKRYLWQVEILCNNNRPSRNPLARAEIEVVQIPQTLKTALLHAGDRSQKVYLYAAAGMWYDALGEALASSANGQPGKIVTTLLQDLANLEKTPQKSDLSKVALSDRR